MQIAGGQFQNSSSRFGCASRIAGRELGLGIFEETCDKSRVERQLNLFGMVLSRRNLKGARLGYIALQRDGDCVGAGLALQVRGAAIHRLRSGHLDCRIRRLSGDCEEASQPLQRQRDLLVFLVGQSKVDTGILNSPLIGSFRLQSLGCVGRLLRLIRLPVRFNQLAESGRSRCTARVVLEKLLQRGSFSRRVGLGDSKLIGIKLGRIVDCDLHRLRREIGWSRHGCCPTAFLG